METTTATTRLTLQFLLNSSKCEAQSGIKDSSQDEVLQKVQQENGGVIEPC